MRKSYLSIAVGLFALAGVSLQSCKKTDAIDNNSVIVTPYSLYYSDNSGAIYYTNNGDTIRPMGMPGDGVLCKTLCVADNNLLWLKVAQPTNLFVDPGGNTNSNLTYGNVNPAIDQTGILWAQDQNRVYVTNVGSVLGLAFSQAGGMPHSWVDETFYDTLKVAFAQINTLTQLESGVILGLDYGRHNAYIKASENERWTTRNNTNLPHNLFSLSHIGNTAIAYQSQPAGQLWYSNDSCNTWSRYSATLDSVTCICGAFGQVLLIGTRHTGIFKLDVNTGNFEPADIGLNSNTIISGIVAKQNIYKNGRIERYIYAATNKGLYRSTDMGANWAPTTITGNITTIY